MILPTYLRETNVYIRKWNSYEYTRVKKTKQHKAHKACTVWVYTVYRCPTKCLQKFRLVGLVWEKNVTHLILNCWLNKTTLFY
jgi:hypothetical protein